MPKQVYHIKAFEGGINKKADPRDIEDNQLVEATNVDVSNVGRVTMPGDGKSSFVTVNAENVPVSPTDSEGQDRFDNETPISSGHGLFSFTHDYDFNNTSVSDGTGPNEVNTEFICVNDGADIDIWTDNFEGTDYGPWKDSLISMGTVHNTGTDGNSENLLDVKGVKPVYYKADNGLRVCDANFSEEVIERAMVSGVNLTVSGVSLTTDAGKFKDSDVGTYIKIDSEVMKITAYSAGTGSGSNDVLTVERARFSTKSEAHDADSGNKNIIKINVPKVFTHIKRPILKNAGANTNINKWVQDIQVPEAPKYGALSVYNSNVTNHDGTNLLSSTIYPSEPEKVNLGILKSNLGNTDMFSLDANDNPITSVTTSTETQLILTLSLFGETIDETPIDINAYGFAVGKFLSISGAGVTTASGTALNGVFEIVGFGTGVGQVKILGDEDLVGYQGDGNEQIILEDEVMDDNLKNKYIFGMSYLYDGGGSEMQESSITTAVSAINSLIFSSDFGSNWKTAPSDWSSNAVLDTSNTNSYDKSSTTNNSVISTANGQFLFYDSSSLAITHNTTYEVNFPLYFFSCGSVSVKIYVGLGPDSHSDAKSDPAAEGFVSLDVAQPASGTGVVNVSGIVTTGDSDVNVDDNVGISIQITGANSGGGEYVMVIAGGNALSVRATNTTNLMSKDNSVDFRTVQDIAKSSIAFLCNNSRTGVFNSTTQNNSWNERIEGFRLYMKQVDITGESLADEWLMLYDVDLRLGDISSYAWSALNTDDRRAVVTNNLSGDSIKSIPLITYEANNGYEAGTNLAARYTATATVDRKVYIGNLKIGDKTFPDRMLRSDTDKFDTFPDDGTHFIDVATSDGESIVALESVGDKLIQYKEKTAYVIKVTSEGEELVSTFSGAGVKNPCQIAKSSDGIFWVNSNGIYYYDGEKLSNVSADKFRIDNWLTNEDFKRPVIVGYDKYSNKLIILTTNISGASSSGYIYDISNSSVTQHDNLFNWYQLSNPGDVVFGNSESEV